MKGGIEVFQVPSPNLVIFSEWYSIKKKLLGLGINCLICYHGCQISQADS